MAIPSQITKSVEKKIRVYLKSNLYLYNTDNPYTIHCHLKPRLISNAVENACSGYHSDQIIKKCGQETEAYKELFLYAMLFAIKYLHHLEKANNQ